MILTDEEIFSKAESLSKARGKKVYPIVVIVASHKDENGNEIVDDSAIGYILEPSRQAKLAAWDVLVMQSSPTLAGEAILKSSLIQEESDPRLFSMASENDKIVGGACIKCSEFTQMNSAELKKKIKEFTINDPPRGISPRGMCALIRHYHHIDPYMLSEDDFALHWCEVVYVMKSLRLMD